MSDLQKMISDFDKAPEDGRWDGDHPIVRLAADRDRVLAENQRLTDLLDEGQSLAGDACSEPFTYAMSRLLGDWVNKVNAELYRQAGASDD